MDRTKKKNVELLANQSKFVLSNVKWAGRKIANFHKALSIGVLPLSQQWRKHRTLGPSASAPPLRETQNKLEAYQLTILTGSAGTVWDSLHLRAG